MQRIHRFRTLLVVSVIALFYGCAGTPTPFPNTVWPSYQFPITVNSIASPAAMPTERQYILLPGMKNVKSDDLQFMEFEGYIEKVLRRKGYTRTTDDKKADLLIFLSYGMGDPRTTSYTFTTSYGYSFPVGDMWFSAPAKTQTNQVVSYKINLVLDAYDIKTAGQQHQIWKTTVTSSSRIPNNVPGGIFVVTYYDISDLRVQIPYMVAAAQDYFGTNTRSTKRFVIRGDDPRVSALLQ